MGWNWVANSGAANSGIYADNNGNFYVAGYFTHTTSIAGALTLSTMIAYDSDLYIAKLNSSGTPLWATSVGSSSISAMREILDMDVDANGNTYVTGNFNGNMIIGSNTLSGTGSSNVFLMKFDANGNYVWGRRMNNTGGYGYGVKVDPSGNPVITGFYQGTLTAETHTLTGPGIGSSLFVVKYDANGNYLWSLKGGNGGANFAFDIDIDNSGDIYITGKLDMSNQSIGSQTINIPNGGLFCAKINSLGTTTSIKSISNFKGYNIKLLPNSDIVILAEFMGTVTVGSQTFVSNGSTDAALIRFTNDNQTTQNTYNWISTFGSTGPDLNSINGKMTIKGNEIYMGLTTYSNIIVGSNTYTLSNLGNGCIVKPDFNGSLQFLGFYTSSSGADLQSIASDANYVYIGGSINNNATFGSFNLNWGGIIGRIGTGPTSVKEHTKKNTLEIYPIPSNGNVIINVTISVEIQITDIRGKIIEIHNLDGGIHNLNLSLPKGIYFVKVPKTGECHKIIIN